MDPEVVNLLAQFGALTVDQKSEFKAAVLAANKVDLETDLLGAAIVEIAIFIRNRNYGDNQFCNAARQAYNNVFMATLINLGLPAIPDFDQYMTFFTRKQSKAFKYDHFKGKLEEYHDDLANMVPAAGPVNPALTQAINILDEASEWMDDLVN